LSAALAAKARGDTEEAVRLWDATKEYVCQHEGEVQRVFDPSAFFSFMEQRFRIRKKEVEV